MKKSFVLIGALSIFPLLDVRKPNLLIGGWSIMKNH